jgi:hypothetical protein
MPCRYTKGDMAAIMPNYSYSQVGDVVEEFSVQLTGNSWRQVRHGWLDAVCLCCWRQVRHGWLDAVAIAVCSENSEPSSQALV